jgi:hypothetical protein
MVLYLYHTHSWPKLNYDAGEALYRFLLAQSEIPPVFQLHCRGTHTERRTRWVTGTLDGRQNNREETETITITDFDFYLDLAECISPGHIDWSVSDTDPAYRGSMSREIEGAPLEQRRKAAAERWRKQKAGAGLPPWLMETGMLPSCDKVLS